MPYFDHNATTPLAAIARETWLRASDENWHNPSSPYRDAAKARIRLDAARERLAEFLGATAAQVVFNSGATESAHAILRHLARHSTAEGRLLLNRTEHPCVLAAAEESFSGRIEWLDTTRDGTVSPDRAGTLLEGGGVAAVVVMAANNETGVLQPWAELAGLCRKARVPYVCDASQWLGKLPSSGFSEVDWVFATGHKFGGPKGTGFLKIPADARSFSSQPGGEQEHGHRGGTENIPSIWALVSALGEAEQKKMFLETERLRWREAFERHISSAIAGTIVVGEGTERLWNTVSLVMPAGENQRWVAKLDKLGFQVSTGSACATGKQGPSHVLSAMGFPADEARRVLRISSGWETSEADWQALGAALVATAPSLNGGNPDVVKA
jgi:cysteine desulfurase